MPKRVVGGRSIRGGESGLIDKERNRNCDGNDEVFCLKGRQMGFTQGGILRKMMSGVFVEMSCRQPFWPYADDLDNDMLLYRGG